MINAIVPVILLARLQLFRPYFVKMFLQWIFLLQREEDIIVFRKKGKQMAKCILIIHCCTMICIP